MPPSRAPVDRPPLSWSGWGDPAAAAPLSDGLRRLVREGLGAKGETPPPPSIDAVPLTPARLPGKAHAALAANVGDVNLCSDHEARVRHALGKSTLDLLAIRSGVPLPAPDVVLSPGSHGEVGAVLRTCSEHNLAVVPFGGGTSVVGGLTPDADAFAGWVALDLRRLNRLLDLDEISRLAVLEAGLRGPEAESLLQERGYTIGHFPQSFEYATLGGFAAARSSGQASAGYGRFDDLVVAMQVATPAGTLQLGHAPKSAAGPDLRQLILGSEGTLGVITELTIQVQPRPETRIYDGWRLESFAHGITALRGMAQDGPLPAVVRLSDEAETAIGGGGGGCLVIVGYEGSSVTVEARRQAVSAHLTRAGATTVPGAGDGWARDRYRGPYLRDSLLDAGALVETLETATFWSSLEPLYAAVTTALRDSLTAQGTPPVILGHVSHVYPSGASLYFTVACAQAGDPGAQWRQAKAAASEAILAAGGSISHHHGVGRDHVEWLEREVGSLSTALLRAAKRTLDPAGILNPGILVSTER